MKQERVIEAATVEVDMFTLELGYVRIQGYVMEEDKTIECIKLQLIHSQGDHFTVDYDILTDECRIYFEELAYKEYKIL
mgnify:FL=1